MKLQRSAKLLAFQQPVRRSVLPQTNPVRRAIQPAWKPRLLFTRDDASGTGKPAKVLVVEDDYLVAIQIEQALSDAGFEVAGVHASAEEAIDAAAAQRVALVVMDIRLAGRRDGVEAAIELFGRHGIRSIFATAHMDAETRNRAAAAQPLDWLQKPYSMASLIDSVRKSLNTLSNKH
jgi:DNA-binding NtrC family response regulator